MNRDERSAEGVREKGKETRQHERERQRVHLSGQRISTNTATKHGEH